MREMPLPCHNHIVVLKRVNPPGSLIATLVRPLVQLLRKIDETNRRRHPQQYIGIINCYNARHCHRKCCLADLVDISVHLPVRDGSREFAMALDLSVSEPFLGPNAYVASCAILRNIHRPKLIYQVNELMHELNKLDSEVCIANKELNTTQTRQA